MKERLLNLISNRYPLKEKECEIETLKAMGMRFIISAYSAEGLGNVSYMEASGLMNMSTLIITPTEVDLPLYSLDRITVMGKEKLYLELYDTLSSELDLSSMEKVILDYSSLSDIKNQKEHWYDHLHLKGTVYKTAGKKEKEKIEEMIVSHLSSYLSLDAPKPEGDQKRKKTLIYVDGLLKNGGPSTSVFLKKLGAKRTADLFHNTLFGV